MVVDPKQLGVHSPGGALYFESALLPIFAVKFALTFKKKGLNFGFRKTEGSE
jgi:hypothetical protein